MVISPKRFDIFSITLDPTVGSEIKKTRPAVIISPDEMNDHLNTVIIAPMTTAKKLYPTRVPITFHRKNGFVALDQIRTTDKVRLIKKLGVTEKSTQQAIVSTVSEIFAL